MSNKYFKSDAPVVLSAFFAQQKAKQELLVESKKIATKFDGSAVFSSSLNGISFYGIKLNNYHTRDDNILWTSPERSSEVSRPRSSIKKQAEWTKVQFSEIKQRLVDLKQQYEAIEWPVKVDIEPLLSAIGTSSGMLFFNGLCMFEHNGALFIKTSLTLSNCTEILGSEFDAADLQQHQIRKVVA